MLDAIVVPGSQMYRTKPDFGNLWYETLAQRLGNAALPDLPIPPHQTWDNWSEQIEPLVRDLKPGGLIVAHSLGSYATLLKLQELLDDGEIPDWSMLMVAPLFRVPDVLKPLDTPERSNLSNFLQRPVELQRARNALGRGVRLIYTIDDRIVPFETQDYPAHAERLGGQLIELPSGGHFQKENAGGHIDLLFDESQRLLDPCLRRGVERL